MKCAAWQGEKHQNLVTSSEGGKCEFKYTKYQISTGTKVNPCVSRQGMMKSSLSIGGTPPWNSSLPLLQCTMYWTQLILTCWEGKTSAAQNSICAVYTLKQCKSAFGWDSFWEQSHHWKSMDTLDQGLNNSSNHFQVQDRFTKLKLIFSGHGKNIPTSGTQMCSIYCRMLLKEGQMWDLAFFTCWAWSPNTDGIQSKGLSRPSLS